MFRPGTRRFIRHVRDCLEKADQHVSKLPDEVLQLPGMSGQSTRHLLNRLCALEGVRYLEVGSWQGSTLCAALHRNEIEGVAIDDWSGWGGPREECMRNVGLYAVGSKVQFIEQDFTEVDTSTIGTFDVYFFDGPHRQWDQYRAIKKFYDNLNDVAVVIIDDWNWRRVRAGTYRALYDLKVPVVFEQEIRLTDNDSHTPRKIARETWHNGMYLFVIDKQRRPRWWAPWRRIQRREP